MAQSVQQQIDALTSLRGNDADNMDAFFRVAMAGLVFLMQFGFAIRECGAVRVKNATRVLLRTILCTVIAILCYWTVGYGLAFGTGNPFLGERFFAAAYLPELQLSHLVFHLAVTSVMSSIVCGVFAERCRLLTYILTTVLLSGFLEPCVSHWAWAPEGWLKVGVNVTGTSNMSVTFQDYAGSGVIHLTAGLMGLIGCLLVGPRLGRFDECGKPNEMLVHSTPLTALGSFLIMVGFLGLTTGILGHISQPGDGATIGLVGVNLLVSGSTSAMTAAITQVLFIMATRSKHRISILNLSNGVLVGMVSVSASADSIYPWSAAVIGLIAGLSFLLWSWFFLRFRVDDPLDIVAVHVGGGLWGLLAAPLFTKTEGIFFAWNTKAWALFGWNLAGVMTIAAWVMLLSVFLYGILFACKQLRVESETEKTGQDHVKYGEPAYGEDSNGKHHHHHHHSHLSHHSPCYSHHDKEHVYKPTHSSSYPKGMYGSSPQLRWKF